MLGGGDADVGAQEGILELLECRRVDTVAATEGSEGGEQTTRPAKSLAVRRGLDLDESGRLFDRGVGLLAGLLRIDLRWLLDRRGGCGGRERRGAPAAPCDEHGHHDECDEREDAKDDQEGGHGVASFDEFLVGTRCETT